MLVVSRTYLHTFSQSAWSADLQNKLQQLKISLWEAPVAPYPCSKTLCIFIQELCYCYRNCGFTCTVDDLWPSKRCRKLASKWRPHQALLSHKLKTKKGHELNLEMSCQRAQAMYRSHTPSLGNRFFIFLQAAQKNIAQNAHIVKWEPLYQPNKAIGRTSHKFNIILVLEGH